MQNKQYFFNHQAAEALKDLNTEGILGLLFLWVWVNMGCFVVATAQGSKVKVSKAQYTNP